MSNRLTALRRSLGDLNSSYTQAVALVFSLERLYGGKYVPHIGSHRSPFLYLKILIAAGTAGGAMATGAPFSDAPSDKGANVSPSPVPNLTPPPSLPAAPPPIHHPATTFLPFPHMNLSSNGEESGGLPGSVPIPPHAIFLQGESHPEKQTMYGNPPPLFHTTTTTAVSTSPPSLLFSGGNGDTNKSCIGGGESGGVGGFWALSQRDYLLGLLDIFMPRRTQTDLSMRESLMDFCSAMWSSSFRSSFAGGDPTYVCTSSSASPTNATCRASRTSSPGSSFRKTSSPDMYENSFASIHSSPSSPSSPSSSSSTQWSAEELVGLYRRKLAIQEENSHNHNSNSSVLDGNPSSSSMMGASSSSPSPPLTTTTTTSSPHERGEGTSEGNEVEKSHIPSTTSSSTSFYSPSTPTSTPLPPTSATSLPIGSYFQDDRGGISHYENHYPESGSFSSSSSPSSPLMPSCDPNELFLLDSITAISSSFFQGVTGRVLVFDAIATCMAAEETIRLEALKRRRGRKLRTLWEFYQKEAAADPAAGATGLPLPSFPLSYSSFHSSTSPTSSSCTTTTMMTGGGGGRLHPPPNHPNSFFSSSSLSMENPVSNGAGAKGDRSTSSSSSSSSSSCPSSLYFPSRPPPRYYSGAQRDKIHRIAQGIAVSSAMTERMEQLLRQEKQQGWIKRRLLLLSPYQPTTTPRALEQYPFPLFGPLRNSHHPSLSSLTRVTPAGGGGEGGVECLASGETKVPRADELSSSTEKNLTEEKDKRGEKGSSPQPTGPSGVRNNDVGVTTPTPTAMKTMMKKKEKAVKEKAAACWSPDQHRRAHLLTRMRPEEEVEDFILRCEPIRQHMIRVIRRGRKQMMGKKMREQLEQQQHQEQEKVE